MLSFEELEKRCLECHRCNLYQTRSKVVFGSGNRNADIMFIGEGPGEKEDLRGEVFVGPAGQLLDKMLKCINLDRNKVYISNVVKCRPPKNRDPKEDEQTACLPYLRGEVKFIHPKIIVCLGRVAAKAIIRPDFRITKEHGIWIERAGYWIIATYHPSALLRDPSKKRDAYEDLKIIRKKLDDLSDINAG